MVNKAYICEFPPVEFLDKKLAMQRIIIVLEGSEELPYKQNSGISIIFEKIIGNETDPTSQSFKEDLFKEAGLNLKEDAWKIIS